MTKRHLRRVRLAFEPNRFASEQLVKVYEQLKPIESRSAPMQSSPPSASNKRSSAKGGGQ